MPVLSIDTINPAVVQAEYAVRGRSLLPRPLNAA